MTFWGILINRLRVIKPQTQVILCVIVGVWFEFGSPVLRKLGSTAGNVLPNWKEIMGIIMSVEEPTLEEMFKY